MKGASDFQDSVFIWRSISTSSSTAPEVTTSSEVQPEPGRSGRVISIHSTRKTSSLKPTAICFT